MTHDPDLLSRVAVSASLGGLELPVVGLRTRGGMDHVSHTANLRPGADHELTGRRAYEDTFRVPFLTSLRGWGDDLFPTRYEAVVRLCEQQVELRAAGTPLELRHPLYGTFPVVVHTWETIAGPDTRNGAWFEFAWKEHRDAASLDLAAPTAPDVAQRAEAADQSLADVGVRSSLGADVRAYFAAAASGQLLPADQEVMLRAMEARARAMLSLPTLALSSAPGFSLAHAAVVSLERLLAAIEQQRRATTADPARVRSYVTPRAMTFTEVSLALFGTLDLAAYLRAHNPVAGALVPAGTHLTVPPRP